jgi:DNA-binding NtrC family response regulator
MAEVLIVDDDRNLRETLGELFASAGYRVRSAANGKEALDLLEQALVDVVFCDWKMPVSGGEQVLRALESQGILTTMPVIIMSAFGDGLNAMQAMQLGAYDFVSKPMDADNALAIAQRAVRHTELQKEVERLRRLRLEDRTPSPAQDFDAQQPQLIGRSPAWIEVFKEIGRVAGTDVSVLLLGESGTGKEVVARTIHENSKRAGRTLVTINCAAIPAELIESELFGHERGAFTSAVSQKIGKFEAAEGGTIFLDEIGELPLLLQPKLLRVLQERTYERVGGTRPLRADVRIIAATNRLLEEEVEEKTFRADLFYRLNAFTLRLPPLRARRSDILPLAEYFLARYSFRNRSPLSGLTEDAAVLLQQYPFPGNVRELEQLVDRLAVQAAGRAITADQLRDALYPEKLELSNAPSFESLIRLPFHESVALWERVLIERALRLAKGNKSEAAKQLGIHRRLLYEKIQQHGIRG